MDWKGCGAGGRTRTDMSVTSPDFESGAYTNFATPAFRGDNNKASSDTSATFHVVRVVTRSSEFSL